MAGPNTLQDGAAVFSREPHVAGQVALWRSCDKERRCVSHRRSRWYSWFGKAAVVGVIVFVRGSRSKLDRVWPRAVGPAGLCCAEIEPPMTSFVPGKFTSQTLRVAGEVSKTSAPRSPLDHAAEFRMTASAAQVEWYREGLWRKTVPRDIRGPSYKHRTRLLFC